MPDREDDFTEARRALWDRLPQERPLQPVINCADLFGPIDWEQIRWDQFAGARPPVQHVAANGRSWHWTRRARVLGWSLLIVAAGAVGYFAYLLPWVRNP